MSKQSVPDLKDLFKQASEIAQQVPKSMQEAAFNRAIDLLTGSTHPQTPNDRKVRKRNGRNKAAARSETSGKRIVADELLSTINSTQYPGVKSASKVLDRSLMVLQIALNDHNVDGLTPSEIAKILTDKFRIRTSSAAVRMALGDASSFVDRVPEGQGFLYKTMGPGEEYLARLEKGEASPASANQQRKPTKKRAARKAMSKTSPQEVGSEKEPRATKRRKSSQGAGNKPLTKSGTGPKAEVLNLIESDFFSTGKTGPEVQAYLKHKRGLNFGTA